MKKMFGCLVLVLSFGFLSAQVVLDCPTKENDCIPQVVMDFDYNQKELYDKLKLNFYPRMTHRECDEELFYLQGRIDVIGFLGFKELKLNTKLIIEVKDKKIRLTFEDSRIVWPEKEYYLNDYYAYKKGKWMFTYSDLIQGFEDNLNNFINEIRLNVTDEDW